MDAVYWCAKRTIDNRNRVMTLREQPSTTTRLAALCSSAAGAILTCPLDPKAAGALTPLRDASPTVAWPVSAVAMAAVTGCAMAGGIAAGRRGPKRPETSLTRMSA
jgi:hypothetical protein